MVSGSLALLFFLLGFHGWLGLKPGWLGLRPGWLGLRPGWMAQKGEWTDVQTENLPILQGRWPASPMNTKE